MPHIRLEYSSNIQEKGTFDQLFSEIHQMLEKQLPTKLLSCKSRAIECKNFYLGDGKAPTAFIHLELKAMKGRTIETLNRVGTHLLAILHHHFAQSAKTLDLEISLEIVELQDTYFSSWHTLNRS